MGMSAEDAVRALMQSHPNLATQMEALLDNHNYTVPSPHLCKGHDDVVEFGTKEWWVFAGMTFTCVGMGAMAAGLTMGYTGLDILSLHITNEANPCECSTEEERAQLAQEKRWVKKVLPLVSKHHLLLVTLLLLNACANEAMPLFLDHLVPSWLSVIISVTFVLFFGEIVPSAVFTGPAQLRNSAFFSGIVWVLLVVLSPIAWPISKVLDLLFGHSEASGFTRSELMALTRLHLDAQPDQTGHDGHEQVRLGGLNADEVRILQGVMGIEDDEAQHVMMGLEKMFALEVEDKLDFEVMAKIMASGFSRIPVYRGRKSNIVGLLLVKRLIVLDPGNPRRVGDFAHRKPHFIGTDMRLMDALNLFLEGKSHVGIVTALPEEARDLAAQGQDLPEQMGALGMVTIEDVIERLINRDIVDETDTATAERQAPAGSRLQRGLSYRRFQLSQRSMLEVGGGGGGSSSWVPQRWKLVQKLVLHRGSGSADTSMPPLTNVSSGGSGSADRLAEPLLEGDELAA
jgi:CBS domain containing-hemolysin-like protein